MVTRFVAAICLMMPLSNMTCGAAPIVEPKQSWSGEIKDESLRRLAPQSGFIADSQTWKKLWTTWRPDKELPKVDFSKFLILVGTVPGPNEVVLRATFTTKGNVKFNVSGTEIAGPGFGYKLTMIDRKGVRTVNGQAASSAQQDFISVTVVGTLQTGILAIGGETTGTTITSKGITWELDMGELPTVRKAAEKLNGKKVMVRGSLELRKGTEVRQRWIVTVTHFEAANNAHPGSGR